MIKFLKKRDVITAFSQRLNYCLIRGFQQGLAIRIDRATSLRLLGKNLYTLDDYMPHQKLWYFKIQQGYPVMSLYW